MTRLAVAPMQPMRWRLLAAPAAVGGDGRLPAGAGVS